MVIVTRDRSWFSSCYVIKARLYFLYFYSYTSRWCRTKSPIILLYLILRSFFDTLLFLVTVNREGRFCARWQNISNCTPACIINPAIRVSLPTLAFAQINRPTVWYNRDIVYNSVEDKSYGIQSDTGNVLVFMNVLYWPTVAKNTADSFRISQYMVSFLEVKNFTDSEATATGKRDWRGINVTRYFDKEEILSI